MFDFHRVGAADRPHLLLLEHAQELHLQAHRHVADLVQQQRAAVRGLEQAFVGAMRARERALLVTEQLGLEQILGHRAAVDRDERALLARARAMDRARHELLAGARFARDQHARVGARDHPRLLQAPSIAGLRVMISALHSSLFFGRPDTFIALLDVVEQLLLVDRLGQEAECAALRRLHGVGIVPCAVRSSTHRPGRCRWISFNKAIPSMFSMRRSLITRSGRNRANAASASAALSTASTS